MRKKTSRVLNDDAFLLGLSYSDITGAGVFLLGLLMLGKIFGIHSMLWALVLAVGVLSALIPVRMNFRRKIIRDALNYLVRKGTQNVSHHR